MADSSGSIPLPTQEDDISDNGITDSYVIRVTSHSKFTQEEIKQFLLDESLFFQYVVGKELIPQEHYHIVLTVDVSASEQDVRDIIRAFLIPKWQLDGGKLPKGFGNKQYNLQVCEDIDAAVSYAVKCKDYWFEGFSSDYINERLTASFEKKKPSNFKAEYILLCEDFQSSDMEVRQFMTLFIQLKSKYGQQVRMLDAYSYALSNLIKRDPSEAENYVENYLYKL